MRDPQQHNRREFLKHSVAPLGASLALAATSPWSASANPAEAGESAAMVAARKKAQQRRRRLIYNDDGFGPLASPTGNTADGFLYGPQSRMGALRGSQVDSVFICTSGTHVLNHPTTVAESYADVVQRYGIGGEWEVVRANIRALEALKTDAIQLTIDHCRKEALEVFCSHRINDIHNTFLEVERSTWFREHPKFWMSTPEEAANAGGANSPRHWWSALDFEQPEVLDHLVRIQEEACGKYDIDGVEIDYFRSPMFFRPNLDFRPATAAQVEILTGFQRRLRQIHLQAGNKRGRPILTATRVPSVPATCRHVGIDIQRWLKEGLLDVLTVGGGYVPFTEPLEEIVKLAHSVGVPIYSTISSSGMRGPDNRYSTVEAWRGAASNMWHAGVDGIVTFNIFPSVGPEPRFVDIGSKQTLAGRNKLFVIDPVRVLEGDLVQGCTQTQALPLSIPGDGKPVVAGLPIGDDLPAAGKAGGLASADLRICLSDPQAIDVLEITLNGAILAMAAEVDSKGWFIGRPMPEQYCQGRNELTFRATRVSPDAKTVADVTHVEVSVQYK